MKNLLKILGGGFLAFMVLAMAQEWEVFSSAWFGAPGSAVEVSEADRKAASDTVHLTLTLMQHLYASGGDPRFAERMPASPGVVDEMLADIDYLSRNHRRQEMELQRLEVASIEALSEDALDIRTREYWSYRINLVVDSAAPGEPDHQRTYGKYLVIRRGQGWQVARWELDEPPAGEPGAP